MVMVPKKYEKVATVNVVTYDSKQIFQPQLGFNQSLNKKLEQKAKSYFSRKFKKCQNLNILFSRTGSDK